MNNAIGPVVRRIYCCIFSYFMVETPVCNILSYFLLCWVMTLPCMFFLQSFCFWALLWPLGGTGNTAGWLPQLCWNPICHAAFSLVLALGYYIHPLPQQKDCHPHLPQPLKKLNSVISSFMYNWESLLFISSKCESHTLKCFKLINALHF